MHHWAGLRALLEQAGRSADDARELVELLTIDWKAAAVEPADQAMLRYAYDLTVRPAEVGTAYLRRLRDAGFADRAIHDICAIVAYFAFVNRIADGLAVDLEPRFAANRRHPAEG